MTERPHLAHRSETLHITATQRPHPITDLNHITFHPSDWLIHMTVRAPIATPDDRDALRRLLEYALATLDHIDQGPDACLDDPEAQR
jgi:hypothetical protein